MVTAAAMRLEEEGRLPLQAPVTRWLPDFRPSAPQAAQAAQTETAEPRRPTITIEQLITHTSGPQRTASWKTGTARTHAPKYRTD